MTNKEINAILNHINKEEAMEVVTPDNKGSQVDHPSHYNQGKYECIDVMAETFGLEDTLAFCKLNAFKYIWRCKDKNNQVEDIEKAAFYLNKSLDYLKLMCEKEEKL